jgi:hypothetical protein
MSLKDRLTGIFDVFSRRAARRGSTYKLDALSEQTRRRIVILYRDVIAGQWQANSWSPSGNYTEEFWTQIHNALEHLYGRVRLSAKSTQTFVDDAVAFVLECTTEEFFDVLELSFRVECMWRILHERNDLVDAINEIFRVENAPYQLTRVVTREEPNSGPFGQGTTIHTVAWPRVVRADDDVTYSEAVAPALSVLSAPHFEAASLEFRDALDEYRKGHYGDCVTKCGSAFESVMKVLCTRNGWQFDPKKATASTLLTIVLGKSSLDGFFAQPLTLIATMRNKLSSAHGGGTKVRAVERHIAQYALTSTAAAIVLLVHEVGA